MKKIHHFKLGNGVQILAEPVKYVQSVALGLSCKTGSRHELDHEAGITHLIEHMLFKGTKNRTAKQIAEEIEGKGGVLNAFTDKELTCYYCRMLSEDIETGIDVLCDMILHPLLDSNELEKEKGVILEEIKRSEDDPSEHVHELHISNRWGEHPLGKPIIGTKKSVSRFKREDILSYMNRRYLGDNVLLSVAGHIDPHQIKELVEKRLGPILVGGSEENLSRPTGKKALNEIFKEIEQVHFCIGADSCSLYEMDDLYTMWVLDGILGGGMSSRLFQEIREKRGLVYAIGSYNASYSAGGAFTIYGGTNVEAWPYVQVLVRTEFDKLMQGDLQDDELEKVKKNLCGHLVLGLEGMSSRMMRMLRHQLFYHRSIPVEETLQNINAVTKEKIVEMAQRVLHEDLISATAIGPFKS